MEASEDQIIWVRVTVLEIGIELLRIGRVFEGDLVAKCGRVDVVEKAGQKAGEFLN